MRGPGISEPDTASPTVRAGTPRVLGGPARSVASLAARAAAVDCPLLILGETGVGKGVLAQWIHAHSPRSNGPFVPVNCGAIPESLIDSQLFGHARGAFSGADNAHLGLVRAAEGGTLLLDEIGELPLTAQTRLLRLLEEREAQPVGFSRPVHVDVRIIVAANRDPREAVGSGAFREDLYFRLDIIRLHLPPLRQCPQEIPGLIDQFNGEFADLYQQPKLAIDPEAMQLLQTCPWPGNVRQLRTAIERLHVLYGGLEVTAAELGTIVHSADAPHGNGQPQSLQDARLEAVNRALSACGGSITSAATALGVHRSTVYRWLSARRELSATA